ncbi:MAG: hypothetical protein AAF958_06870 [Planctomycetota bacterium]
MLIRMDPDCDAWWHEYYGGTEEEIRELCVIESHLEHVDALLADATFEFKPDRDDSTDQACSR